MIQRGIVSLSSASFSKIFICWSKLFRGKSALSEKTGEDYG